MQTVGRFANAVIGSVYDIANGTRHSQRSKQSKKDYGAKQRRNSFLKTVFSPIAPKSVTRRWIDDEYNYITKENYSYLLKSATHYASLLGVQLKHDSGKSIGEGISNLYDELNDIIGDINLNIEPFEEKLNFVLWKYHEWGKYTFYWMPVKFTETLNPKLRKIALSFIHHFIRSNGMSTTNDSSDMEWIIEYAYEGLCDSEPCDKETHTNLLKSYDSGKIHELMQSIYNKSYCKNLSLALKKYVPNNDFERQMVDVFTEGLQFIGKNKPSIMSYGYDPLYDEDRDYYPVEMDRIIRVVYDLEDFVSEFLMEYTNNELNESYDISPATFYIITPNTSKPFSMDQYPDNFFKWFDKFSTLIS